LITEELQCDKRNISRARARSGGRWYEGSGVAGYIIRHVRSESGGGSAAQEAQVAQLDQLDQGSEPLFLYY